LVVQYPKNAPNEKNTPIQINLGGIVTIPSRINKTIIIIIGVITT
jgi:hypothetical protein